MPSFKTCVDPLLGSSNSNTIVQIKILSRSRGYFGMRNINRE